MTTTATILPRKILKSIPGWVLVTSWKGDSTRIRDVAYAIESNKRHFDMSSWFSVRSHHDRWYDSVKSVATYLTANGIDDPTTDLSCGTTGCMAGWLVLNNTDKFTAPMLKLGISDAAVRLLGVYPGSSASDKWHRLFGETDLTWLQSIRTLLYIADQIDGLVQ